MVETVYGVTQGRPHGWGAQARARRRGGCDVLITKYTKSDKDRSKIQNSS